MVYRSFSYEIEYIVVRHIDQFRKYLASQYDFFVNWDKDMIIMTPINDNDERDIIPMSSIVKIHEVKVYGD